MEVMRQVEDAKVVLQLQAEQLRCLEGEAIIDPPRDFQLFLVAIEEEAVPDNFLASKNNPF